MPYKNKCGGLGYAAPAKSDRYKLQRRNHHSQTAATMLLSRTAHGHPTFHPNRRTVESLVRKARSVPA